LTTAFTVVFLFTVFMPQLCRRSSAFYTTVVGLIGLVIWEIFPVLHVMGHPIYFEWIICTATFLLTAVFDSEPIKQPLRVGTETTEPKEEFGGEVKVYER